MKLHGKTRIAALCSIMMVGVLAVFALTACSGDEASDTESASYKIGVVQTIEHGALDQANQGFVDALADAGIPEDCIDQQNAQGEQSSCVTIANKFVNDGDDLVLAIGTQAAQAASGATSEIPIVGTAITDYASTGLVESDEVPGGNVTGTSDLTPVAEQIDLLHQLIPDAKTVGILYCSGENNSLVQVEMAEAALDDLGIAHERYTVSSSNEIQQVVESSVGNVDALYAPTDNTIAAGMSTVSMVANENKIPVVVGCDTMVEDGGLVSYSINYYDLGYKAGEMGVKILKGEASPADMPIEYLDKDECRLIVNQETADALGIDVSGLEDAEVV